MNHITICLPFYRNKTMLAEQARRLRAVPDDLKPYLRLIVVDDGSRHPQQDETHPPRESTVLPVHEDIGFPFELYAIEVNKRWNQDAARNIAAHHAPDGWLLLTDMDHIPLHNTLRLLVEREFDLRKVYRFARQTLEPSGECTPYKPHPNSWFMTKKTYDRLEGYDESFSGFYGTDADFRSRIQEMIGEPIMLDDAILLRVPRDTIPDASTTSYERKTKADKGLGDLINARNRTPGWHTRRLTFPYHRVA